jgi:tetratricopeptide (TPR) repeat protein
MAEEARALAEAAADRRAQAQAHNLLGVLARGAGELEAARAQLERSLLLAEELDDAAARTAALNNLALVAREAGELDRSLALTGQALELCVATGDRHREAALENNLADLHHAAGREDRSRLTSSAPWGSSPRWAPTRPPACPRSGSSSAGDVGAARSFVGRLLPPRP